MSTQHTPGPWSLTEAAGGGSFVDQVDQQYRIAFVYAEDPIEHVVTPQNRADAHIIAAAPDLYAIAQHALTACERVNGVASGVDFCALAVGLRAAIAKAEGKS